MTATPQDNRKLNPTPIFWDVDDTLLNSSEAFVNCLENYQKFSPLLSKVPNKDIVNLKDWGYRSINKYLTTQDVESIFESEEFWEAITFKPEALELFALPEFSEFYTHIFVTKGIEKTHKIKKEFLYSNILKIAPSNIKLEYVGILLHHPKESVNMKGGIQIDDNANYLRNTNADYKFLLLNNRETTYNTMLQKVHEPIHNLYICNTFKDIADMLKFNMHHRIF